MIDTAINTRQDAGVAFNSAASFGRLIHNGRQAADNSLLSGVFTSATSAMCAPYGGQWQGGLAPAGTLCQSSNPAICPPPQSFGSDLRALKTITKGFIMATIRKAFSRPIIAHPLRTFPTIIQAAAFVDRMTASNADAYRFNITQDGSRWTVSRVIRGAA